MVLNIKSFCARPTKKTLNSEKFECKSYAVVVLWSKAEHPLLDFHILEGTQTLLTTVVRVIHAPRDHIQKSVGIVRFAFDPNELIILHLM